MVNLIHKKNKEGLAGIIFVLVSFIFLFFGFTALLVFRSDLSVDNQCTFLHETQTLPPMTLKTANDYFEQGNYDYDTGNCKRAIIDYSHAIDLNPEYTEAFNNRGYTYMRMKDYSSALPDLNRAIQLRPNYTHALMNRGDIYNFYYNINRAWAIADYDKVIATGQTADTSVCGHRMLAKSGGWRPAVLVYLFNYIFDRTKQPGCF